MAQEGYLVLGRVIRPHGVRGELKVVLFAESWEPFQSLSHCWLGPPGGPFQPFTVEHGRGRKQALVLKLGGVGSLEAAAGLAGYELAVPRAEAPAPPAGSYYHYDILGLEVVEGDRPLGSVCEILETPAHDVYLIRGPAGEWMLPATKTHIRRIDLAEGRIEIQPGTDLVTSTLGGEERAETV